MAHDDKHKYDDIINQPHPTSKKHSRMPICARAAQFSPFAALTGLDEAIEETARVTDVIHELDENALEIMDDRLNLLIKGIDSRQPVTITYFVPDSKKAGGKYVTHTGVIKKLDEYEHKIIFENNTEVLIDRVIELLLLKEA